MPTTRQHPCRAAPPAPRRSRRSDAVGIGGVRLGIAHTRLAAGDRTDAGHDLALRQVIMGGRRAGRRPRSIAKTIIGRKLKRDM
jgi:hypothetical protein